MTATGKRQISAYLPASQVSALDAIAEAAGMSRSVLLERAVQLWLTKQAASQKNRKARL